MTKRVKKTKPKVLVIDRAKWLNGRILRKHGRNFGMLYDTQPSTRGMMCCLGFLGRQCGLRVADIRDRLTYGSDSNQAPITDAIVWLVGITNDCDALGEAYGTIQRKLASINDSDNTPRGREQALKVEFAKHGWQVEFVGKAPRL